MSLIPRTSLLDRWFDNELPGFRLLPETRAEQAMLAVDIHETEKGYALKADFPGLKKEDISVTLDNNVLTLSAEHKEEKEQKEKGRVIRQERRYGKYSRSFSLGNDIDEAGISASFTDGVLTLDIPKTAPHAVSSKSIPVR
jgi:HSP20 family protein